MIGEENWDDRWFWAGGHTRSLPVNEEKIEGLILGCTELPLILTKDEFNIPFLNTAKIHAESVIRYCLGEKT